MIDTDFRVWLIEVNASPSMDMGTSTTERLVTNVLTDLPKVIIDIPNSKNPNNVDTGGFACVYCSNQFVGKP